MSVVRPTRRATLTILAIVVAITAGACGGGDSTSAEPAATAASTTQATQPAATTAPSGTTAPEEATTATDTEPLTFTSSQFAPTIGIAIGESAIGQGSFTYSPFDTRDTYGFAIPAGPTESGSPSFVSFLNDRPLRLSPSSRHKLEWSVDTGPGTDVLASWIHDHPRLKTTEPEPVTVAGIEGKQFDAVLRQGKGYTHPDCGPSPSCVLLLGFEDGSTYYYPEENKLRVISLDVGGEPVVILIEAPKERFDAFAKDASDVLDHTTIG